MWLGREANILRSVNRNIIYKVSLQYEKTTAGAQCVFEVFVQRMYRSFGKSTKKKNDQRSRKYDL